MPVHERLALLHALYMWRCLLAVRHHIPNSLRMALVTRHDDFLNGRDVAA